MQTIRNKKESIQFIKEQNLNLFPEELFFSGEEYKVLNFIEKYPAKYYAIRDKKKAGGVFKLKVSKEDILKEIQEYECFTINVSSANYEDIQVLAGEIYIGSDATVYATLSTKKGASVRDALANPTRNIKTSLLDNKTLNKIPGFNEVLAYIDKNNLFNYIVEFALFTEFVGIKKEKIIIYEIRTNY